MASLHDYLGYTSVAYLLQTLADAPIKRRSYELMQIEPGHTVLDVGCGPGIDTVALARQVSPGGYVAGVDHDLEMIAAANARAQRADVAAIVTHYESDSAALPFPAATFDACRCERVFQHLAEPHATLGEMIRVTRPCGRVVLIDTDWATFSIDTPLIALEQRILRFVLERVLRNGWAGRQLFRLVKQHRLADVTVEAYTQPVTSYARARLSLLLDMVEQAALAAGVITETELQHWTRWVKQAERDGTFFCSVSRIMVSGRRV